MTDGKILLKGDQLFCVGNHLVTTVLKNIGANTKIKVKYFDFNPIQKPQKAGEAINPCFCGKPWITSSKDGHAIPVKIKRNNQFFIPV